jgi:hypothetical protein
MEKDELLYLLSRYKSYNEPFAHSFHFSNDGLLPTTFKYDRLEDCIDCPIKLDDPFSNVTDID